MVGKPIVYLAWNHSGASDQVERDTAGLRVGPTPVTTTIGSSPYLNVQTAHDLAFQWGGRSFIKSQNITFGTAAYGTPLDILNPRTLRLAAQLKF